jgi:hypothetical protein
MELLEKYIQDIANDLKIDDFNIKDVQLRVPGRKHFWAARLIKHKIEIEQLKIKRSKLKHELVEETVNAAPVTIKMSAIERVVEQNENIKDIDNKIKEISLIIELLEKTEKTFASLTYDIANIIKLQQLEQC